jgi:hypothetical protein
MYELICAEPCSEVCKFPLNLVKAFWFVERHRVLLSRSCSESRGVERGECSAPESRALLRREGLSALAQLASFACALGLSGSLV